MTYADNIGSVQITTDGSAAVYYTVDGRTPQVDSANSHEIPAGAIGIGTMETVNSPGGDVVKLISDGTPSIRVERT